MEFIDLKSQYRRIESSVRSRIDAVLAHGKYIMGPEVAELEERLADYTGMKHCVSCANGTDALLLALMTYHIGPGDAVFTTPFTFIATAEVISLLGATPVFVDIDPKTFNIDPQKLRISIEQLKAGGKPSPGTPDNLTPKGIIPVDLFGLPADYDEINKIACDHGLFILEDTAQSLGGSYKGKKCGSLGDMAATSFFPAKPLGCYGDGGAVFTNDDNQADILKSLRVHGQGIDKYNNIRIGINGRLDTIQAAVLLAKLEIFDDEIAKRQEIAGKYSENLCDVVEVPFIPDYCRSAWAQYSVLSDNRDAIIGTLREEGIPAAIYYPCPLHCQTAFSCLGYNPDSMPVSESTAGRILSLPMHPYLEDAQIERIAGVVRKMNK